MEKWLEGRVSRKPEPVWADEDAKYFDVGEYDVTAGPDCLSSYSGQCVSGKRKEGLPIQQCYIGTCTNGRLDDLRVAAAYWPGKDKEGLRLIVAPSSKTVCTGDERRDYQALVEAGAAVVTQDAGRV